MVRPLQSHGQFNSTTYDQNPLNTLRGQWSQTRQLRNNFVAWQPRSVVPTYNTQPEMRDFYSEKNRQFLKQQSLQRFNCVIGDDVLLRQMSEMGSTWFLTLYTEETYGPRTPADKCKAVSMMNERTLHRIGQLYYAQNLVTSQYLQFAHQGPNTNWEQPSYERIADCELHLLIDINVTLTTL